ncbi:MAG: hypothetical protein FD164_1724 [Nitrospirae bacterium]|nr:MAG: hypothetical protein FD164_1724 [Nitrospirota bacterium]
MPPDTFQEEFFVGAWHPSADLSVTVPDHLSSNIAVSQGRNWFIMSSRSPFHSTPNGLVHRLPCKSQSTDNSPREVVAFRGYILEPAIHSWSASTDIINYWSSARSRHNGVFATAIIGARGDQIAFITDAFGVASLYYREFEGGLIFSTNTRFLSMANDTIDYSSARILLHTRSVYGDRSLAAGVHRFPPGSVCEWGNGRVTKKRWFNPSDLPQGTEPVSSDRLRDVELSFQAAIDRCLRLQAAGCVLPLSSGHDSRRILAALYAREIPFHSLTVRVLHKDYRDLDAHWASVMARDIGFKHQVVELPAPDEFAVLDYTRRLLVDSHNTEHTWFLSMYPHYPERQSLIFDGLGGDIWGNTGFGDKELIVCEESVKLQKIAETEITDVYDRIVSRKKWPSSQSVRQVLVDYLAWLPDGRNKSCLAFMLMRARSGTGMCFQRLVPAGHVTVYPYCDLDYISTTLAVDPQEKIPPHTLQARCLELFWPQYYAFPGSRRIPADSRPGSGAFDESLKHACFHQLWEEAGPHMAGALYSLLTARAYAIACMSRVHKGLQRRARWWLNPLLMIVAKQAAGKICWTKDRL